MKTTKIGILNLQCSGCANTIRKSLLKIEGTLSVEVDLNNNEVIISHEDFVAREIYTKQLFTLGYPELNESNSLMSKIISKKSCLLGKFSKD